MYRVVIIAVVIMMGCGKVQGCSNTYITNDYTAIRNQYNSSIRCYNDRCNRNMQQFFKVANSTLTKINMNSSIFKINPKVNLVHMIMFHFDLISFYRNWKIYKVITLKISWQTSHPYVKDTPT